MIPWGRITYGERPQNLVGDGRMVAWGDPHWGFHWGSPWRADQGQRPQGDPPEGQAAGLGESRPQAWGEAGPGGSWGGSRLGGSPGEGAPGAAG